MMDCVQPLPHVNQLLLQVGYVTDLRLVNSLWHNASDLVIGLRSSVWLPNGRDLAKISTGNIFCIFKFHKVLQQYIAGEVEIFLWVKKIVGSYRDIRLREGLSPGDELWSLEVGDDDKIFVEFGGSTTRSTSFMRQDHCLHADLSTSLHCTPIYPLACIAQLKHSRDWTILSRK